MDAGWRLLKAFASLGMAAALLYLGYRFFAASVALLSAEPPRATAGLMAGLAGFTFTAAAVSLVRDWLIVDRAEQREEEKR